MPRDNDRLDQGQSRKALANEQRLRSLGEAMETRHANITRRAPRSRRRVWIRRSLIAIGLVLSLIVGGVVADYYYLGSLVNRQKVKSLQSSGTTENILLIGSTSRCALRVQNKAYGLCSQGVTGVNSDIDMIVHLNSSTGSVSLLSIPRDLFIPNARSNGANKIDAALYGGPSQLVTAIEEDFGIPINHFVELNFDTFASVVDALGGVKMYFPVPLFDAYSGLNIPQTGCYSLDGYHALQVVRARHLQVQPSSSNHNHGTWPQEALSDLARIRRTHEFLRVVAAKVASRGLSNPITDQRIATAVLPNLTVDTGFSESAMVGLAQKFAHTQISKVPQVTYPVVLVETGTYLYQGYYYGDVEFPVQPSGANTISKIFGVAPNMNSFTGKPLPAPSSFPISIQNGSGVVNQAALVERGLTVKGFKVKSTGNVTPVGRVEETVVWYGGPRPPANGNWTSTSLAAAQVVLSQLEGPVTLGYDPSKVTPGALITVQTGTGLSVKALTAVHKKTRKSKSTTTTLSTSYDPPGIKTNNLFSAPSAVSPTLAPYDPRSCNAAGTGPATPITTTTKAK